MRMGLSGYLGNDVGALPGGVGEGCSGGVLPDGVGGAVKVSVSGFVTWTSLLGRCRSAIGNRPNHNTPTIPPRNSRIPASFPGTPYGSLRQIHPYMSAP